jgi:Sec7-like guanine-nucleotide exchange factor
VIMVNTDQHNPNLKVSRDNFDLQGLFKLITNSEG